MSEPIIVLHDVVYRYPTSKAPILRGVNLSLSAGEFVGLVGSTGAGKTTLVQTFNGLIPHYTRGTLEGSVVVHGQPTLQSSVVELSRRVGLVFQDADAQLIMSTVEEECLLGPLSQGYSRQDARQMAQRVLDLLEIPHLAQRPPQALSGGQKQRVAIAAVMVTQPEVLVLDEATSELDALMVRKIFEMCDRFNRELGTTILIVSHEVELLAQYARRILLMDQGRLVADGPPREVFSQPEPFEAAGVRLPQITQIALDLRRYIAWPRLPLSEEEAEAELRRLDPNKARDL
ncbi:MAG: ABC transporter ATP-binding protein [Anaerolineae bacterium]|nr:ABC transporter ATP-binding protein [Anaerolineae bacterium]